jgi:hypothetical protein
VLVRTRPLDEVLLDVSWIPLDVVLAVGESEDDDVDLPPLPPCPPVESVPLLQPTAAAPVRAKMSG